MLSSLLFPLTCRYGYRLGFRYNSVTVTIPITVVTTTTDSVIVKQDCRHIAFILLILHRCNGTTKSGSTVTKCNGITVTAIWRWRTVKTGIARAAVTGGLFLLFPLGSTVLKPDLEIKQNKTRT